MKNIFCKYFFFLLCIAFPSLSISAQTPYDSFHPETSRPMLRLERDTAWRQQIEDDNGSFLIVANHNSCIVMLYDLCGDSLVAVADINPDMLLWLSVDPLADKFIGTQPYLYCNGNPIGYIDPTGKELTITGEDGITVTYVPGGVYEGTDEFTKNMWANLDAISNTKSGGIVVNELVKDDGKAFNITNQVATGPNETKTMSYINGSRLFKMGGEKKEPEFYAHEFFHAYQDLHGYGDASCANDVEAYIFQGLIWAELNNMPFDPPPYLMPNFNADGSQYTSAYFTLIDGVLNIELLNKLAIGFRQYSYAGAMGIADKYSTFSKNQQYKIIKFWK